MRKPLIAGNHKMNMTISEVLDYAKNLIERVEKVNNKDIEILICPPYISLYSLYEITKITNIKIGAQNCHYEENGAFTGEVSVKMLKNAGVEYVILGHSERRHIFNESNEFINKKVKKALENDLNVILCIGEKEEERDNDITNCVNEIQLKSCLKDIDKKYHKNLVIAYEPVWAIGTGKTATPEDAQSAHSYIRQVLSNIYNQDIANDIRILYGGSVKPHNINNLVSQKDIDGALVGGASLKFDSFEKIIKFNS
jgi:triosephosphate isomerase